MGAWDSYKPRVQLLVSEGASRVTYRVRFGREVSVAVYTVNYWSQIIIIMNKNYSYYFRKFYNTFRIILYSLQQIVRLVYKE